MFVKVRDFEKSIYKFIEEGYANLHGYPVYYGNVAVDQDRDDIWLYCNFSQLNVNTGHFSTAYIDIITKIASVDEYNTQLSAIVDELRELFADSNIDLYDFTNSDSLQMVSGSKILIQDSGREIYERVEGLEFEGVETLLQASQMTIKVKLLEDFARSRAV